MNFCVHNPHDFFKRLQIAWRAILLIIFFTPNFPAYSSLPEYLDDANFDPKLFKRINVVEKNTLRKDFLENLQISALLSFAWTPAIHSYYFDHVEWINDTDMHTYTYVVQFASMLLVCRLIHSLTYHCLKKKRERHKLKIRAMLKHKI